MGFYQYLNKRFPLTSHLPLIFLFYLSIYLFAHIEDPSILFSIKSILGFLTIFLIFLHLRFFDDLKDYNKDKDHFPDRPLSTGLITPNQIKQAYIITIVCELFLSALISIQTFLLYLVVLVYSILIYFDFFSFFFCI